jgi:2-hydroxychromene-2-carboxylate isomerase
MFPGGNVREGDWYFDFISPYAYFGLARITELSDRVAIRYRPVLFAAMLNHWGHKGPAEIPSKRVWTYRWCTWLAAQQRVPFRFPSVHPFNPLPFLRLAIAAGCTRVAIEEIFRRLWTTGADPNEPRVLDELLESLHIDRAQLASAPVKEALRAHTDEAIARGVFGVPTLVVDGELFWGADATDFAKAYLTTPGLLATAEMLRVTTLPVGASRQ